MCMKALGVRKLLMLSRQLLEDCGGLGGGDDDASS